MNDYEDMSITECTDKVSCAATPQYSFRCKMLKYLMVVATLLSADWVYADYTVTYQYMEQVVSKAFDRWGGEFDYTLDKKTYTAPTYTASLGGFYGTDKVEYSCSYAKDASWVTIKKMEGILYQTATLSGVLSSSTLPRATLSVQPHVVAMAEENTTSAERSCTLTITLSAKSYPVGVGGA